MRPVHRYLVLALPVLMLVACGDRREKEDDTSASPADQTATEGSAATEAAGTQTTATDQSAGMPPADSSTTPPAGATSQSDALGLLATADEHEVAAADQAIGKKVTGDVLDFARMMKNDHGKNLAETNALGGTKESAKITEMKSQGDAALAALDAKSGTEYEQAYIDAMVKGHADVLALLDGTLIPAATDAAVKTHFTNTRAAVAKHLEAAKKLKAGP